MPGEENLRKDKEGGVGFFIGFMFGFKVLRFSNLLSELKISFSTTLLLPFDKFKSLFFILFRSVNRGFTSFQPRPNIKSTMSPMKINIFAITISTP